ncbi:hypothetical protein TNCV_1082511, partial [Trichonephila clavipes]
MAASSFLPTDLGREDNVEVGHSRSGALQVDNDEVEGEVQQITADLIHEGLKFAK